MIELRRGGNERNDTWTTGGYSRRVGVETLKAPVGLCFTPQAVSYSRGDCLPKGLSEVKRREQKEPVLDFGKEKKVKRPPCLQREKATEWEP